MKITSGKCCVIVEFIINTVMEWPDLPDLGLETRQWMDLLQRGKKITRSLVHREKKVKSRYETLIPYLGQPSLSGYLQNTNIKYKESISTQYLPIRRMRRLSRKHLPQNCIFFQKILSGQTLTYHLRSVRIKDPPNNKKAKQQQYFIQESSRSGLMSKVLTAQDEPGILAAIQTIVLHLLPFPEFQRIFSPIINLFKSTYKALKVSQLQRLTESQPIIQEPKQDRMSQEPIIKNDYEGFNLLQEPIVEEKKLPPKLTAAQIIEIANQQTLNLDKYFYNKLSHPRIGGVLWPCLVLEPLIGQRIDVELMVHRKLDWQSKEQYRMNKSEIKYDEKVFQLAFEEIIQEGSILGFDKNQQLEKPGLNLSPNTIEKIQKIFNNLENFKQTKIIINLIGTHETKLVDSNFLRCQDFSFEQLQTIIANTPYRALLDQLCDHIQCLNKNRRFQNQQIDKQSVFRLGKYENDRGQIELCIPLKIEHHAKEEKRVLVRFLRDQHPTNHEELLLQWIQLKKLSVNYTLPRHSQHEKKFYYIIGNNLSIQEGINYIYSDFYYRPINFSQALKVCYPLNDIRRIKVKQQRCISCFYSIHNLPYYRCKFCLKFCHQECTDFRSKAGSDAETAGVPQDIHDTENDDELWICKQCTPCVECQIAVKSSFIQCLLCKNVYHPICGKVKGLNDENFVQSKYTCEDCLRCKLCACKIKNMEYCIDGENIFCIKCYKDYSNNEYCALCMKQVQGDWIQCDQKPCEKWIHIACDGYFKLKKGTQRLEKINYSCPTCRKLEKRKIYRNVIEQLKYFDEFQYFYDPDYEELIGYKQVIKNPICINQMRQKSIQGTYDSNPFELIKADLELLVKNAMTFNMPKDQAHYRAKILLVVGTKYLEFFKDILQCDQEFVISQNLEEVFLNKKKIFYNDLYEHYLEYILNFKQERGIVEVRKITNTPYEQEFFSSKILLNRNFNNSEFIFKVKKKPHTIQNLFTVPRLLNAGWWPIRQRNCYYHPDQLNPIIYECKICWQTYCCTNFCLNHKICTSCGQKGCGCDIYQCGCPQMKDKQKKAYETKIHSTLSQSKLEKRQYTQYYKYCLKCVTENLKTNWCYICHSFCYYAYEKCKECSKVYHLNCERKNKWEEMAPFFQNKSTYKNSYHNCRIQNICYTCSFTPKYAFQIKQKLMIQTKKSASKIFSISKYISIFNYLYELNCIRLATHEIVNLIYHNFQDFIAKQAHFNEFLLNFSLIIQNMGNNRVTREEFRQYLMNQITRKLHGQTQNQKYISIVETKQIKQLKQSKKFYKIYSKWFNNFYYPVNFFNAYEVKYHLQHLTSKINHYSGLNIGFNQIFQYMITDNHHFATNFREQNHLNYKNFQRIKIQSITSYVSPKSKKNIYYTNKLQKYKLHLSFLGTYYTYKHNKISTIREKPIETSTKKICQPEQYDRIAKEYEKYFRYHSQHENLTDCIYKQQNSKTLLADNYHHENFNPFYENNTIVRYSKLCAYKDHEPVYVNNKSQILYRYLSNFVLKIYEENKVVLKKGNTAILHEMKNSWRILKKIRGHNVQIRLQKRNDSWFFQTGQWSGYVRTVEEIIRRLKELSPVINSFEDVVDFMGFSMTDTTYYEPNHFTHLLQTTPLDSFSKKQRKRQVERVYNKYSWQRQGNFLLNTEVDNVSTKYEYNVTKKQLFFLKKRNNNQEQNLVQPKVVPFITYQDIKKDLEEPISFIRQKENFTIKQPTYDVYIAPSKIDRLGLFIRNYTKKNTVVVQYVGEVIGEAMADLREQKFHFGCYMFGLGKNNTRQQIIDATFIGNMARYLNHSCDPNCKARIELNYGQPRILIYTVRDVKENQQLTYDYQFKIDANDRLACKCKSKNCQGRLT